MKKKVSQYIKEYNVRDILSMVRNNRLDPKICEEDFSKKLVVITGTTSGIGYHTARKYASKGANLLCINRNPEKSEAFKIEIESEFAVQCDYKIVDLSIIEQVHQLAEDLNALPTPIDVLIHNAGVYLTKRELTSTGLDKVFMVQHLSSFIINFLLMDKLKSQDKARIILVNSEAHRFSPWGLRIDDLNWEKRRYSGLKSYGSAKLSQLLSMFVFEEHFKDSKVTINSMHPGAVKSESGRENGPVYRWLKRNFLEKSLRPTDIAAEAIYFLGVSKEIDGVSGKFFNITKQEVPAPPALDIGAAYEIWEKSLEYAELHDSKWETYKRIPFNKNNSQQKYA
ncbi:MAG: SDR family NAD(P)-dependent oxidoreductase [Bacteroidales bacterium]|jgi:retinol dehydrogenase-13|nr:SDR family NAD(P)-dependent oxidoreductase [Bacteroidales bacterium]